MNLTMLNSMNINMCTPKIETNSNKILKIKHSRLKGLQGKFDKHGPHFRYELWKC